MATIGRVGKTVRFSVGKWFLDRDEVLKAVGKKKAARLRRAGAFVWKRMRSLIRPARRKRLFELTDEERESYTQAVERAKRAGRSRPKIWFRAHSKPGDPPRSIKGLLRQHIYFVYDPRVESVVVGPALLHDAKGNVPEILEYGGLTDSYRHKRRVPIEPRPYARRALQEVVEKDKSKFEKLFYNLWK